MFEVVELKTTFIEMNLGERSKFVSTESSREVLKSSAIIERGMKLQKKELKMPILPSVIPEEVERSCNDSTNSKNIYIRVKVVLTKKEATEILAKYTTDANLQVIDVVNESVKLLGQSVALGRFCIGIGLWLILAYIWYVDLCHQVIIYTYTCI